MNISKKGKTDVTSIQIGNKTAKKSSEIANEFNKYFTSIAKEIVKPKHKCYKYLKTSNNNFFFISPANSNEVLSLIKELSNDKSGGPANIPSKFLKLSQTALSKPTSLISNLSLS